MRWFRPPLYLFLLLVGTAASAAPRWHWEDDFTPAERDKLIAWVEQADESLVALFGPLPYDYDVHFHDRGRSREPVPWANTRKWGDRRAVHFHVDPRYSLARFQADWTAYHELTHLMFPYLGDSGRWFAEGIASYFQYQAMYAADELSWERAMARYRDRYAAATRSSRYDGISIAALSRNVRGAYVRLYWGGAAYFMEVDQRLSEQHGKRLHAVIDDYLDCCFGQGRGPRSMIQLFDRISGTRVFSQTYEETVARKGFPSTEALDWLARHPPTMAELRRAP